MAITDLTNTTWVLNSSLSSYPGGTYNTKTYNVNITTETPLPYSGDSINTEDTFVAIMIGYDSGGELNEVVFLASLPQTQYNFVQMASGNDTKSLPDTWQSYRDTSFTITGGTDATNSTLIAWLEQNATTYIPSIPDVVVTYKDAEVTTLSNSGTITLATSGTYCEDDIEIVYTKQGGGGGGILIVETPDSHGGTIMEVTGQNTVSLQNALTITPTAPQQTIYPDTGFDGFASLIVNAAAVPEITVATSGAVTQELQPNVAYHFTSESLTSLTITFGGQATDQYHFDFISTTTPPTLTLPSTVVMPSSFSVEVNTKYEIDILNNDGVFAEWVYEVSA